MTDQELNKYLHGRSLASLRYALKCGKDRLEKENTNADS